MNDFTTALEAHAPGLIGSAWDFLDRRPEVEMIWWYFSRDEGVFTSNPYFQIAGARMTAHEAARRLGTDSSVEAQKALLRVSREPTAAFREAVKTAEVPTRIVMQFRTADSDFTADFFYGDLRPGVPDDELPSLSKVERDWFERLKTTGDASAAL